MRITNKMMTNNALFNINKNKTNLNALDEQYTSGKKIQRPSDDPIIAVRALKLRTNLSELNQYLDKNIPDARSWLDVTHSSLLAIDESLTKINTYCTQGANDSLTAADRTSIVQNLSQIKGEIYQQGDTNYAGRYVFTGYKTDTSLIFSEKESDTRYTITEKIELPRLEKISYVDGSYALTDYEESAPDLSVFEEAPNLKEAYRIQLSYGNLDNKVPEEITYTYLDINGDEQTATIPIKDLAYLSTDKPDGLNSGPYDVENEVEPHFIKDTGEIILTKDAYEQLRKAKSISITYEKTEFTTGDLRPEHYFDCETVDLDEIGADIADSDKKFTKEDQVIEYEINFKQKLQINTQGSDAIKHVLARKIDEILEAVEAVVQTEGKISEVKKLLADSNNSNEQTQVLNKMLEQLETEQVLKSTIMRSKFQQGMTVSSQEQNTINTALADLGSRYVRLDLTEDRLGSQQVEFEDLKSTNEDADIVDTIIRFNSAQQIYNASLAAAAKVVQNSLLDFL